MGVFFTMRAKDVRVQGLAGYLRDGVGLECAVGGSGAGREGFCVEFRGGIIANVDAGFMLGGHVSR